MAKGNTPTSKDGVKTETNIEQSTVMDNNEKSFAPKNKPQSNLESEHPVLKKWADLISDDVETSTEQTPTIKISRFGLKTAKDILIFLRSPAGDSLMAEIGTQMSIEKSLQDYQQLEAREKALLMHRIKAAFFLWYLEKRAYAAEQQEEIIIAQNDKAIRDSGKTTPIPTSSVLREVQKDMLLRSISDYEKALKLNLEKKQELLLEQEALEKVLAKLDKESELIVYKYSLYQNHMDEFDDTMDEFEKLDADASEAEIEERIHQIHEKMDECILEVDELIKSNQDEAAAKLIKIHTALNLNLARHYDAKAVRKGEKYYADENGNKVNSHRNAYFILATYDIQNPLFKDIVPEPKHSKVYKDEYNNYYLLKPGQTWDSIKENPQEKENAQKSFEHNKQELMAVKNLITYTKGLEWEANQGQIQRSKGILASCKNDTLVLDSQKNLIESSIASAKNMLQQLDSMKEADLGNTAPVPRPTVTGGAHHPANKAKPTVSPAHSFRIRLKEIREMQNVTTQDLLNLASQAPANQRIPAKDFVLSAVGAIPRTAPIPYVTMQFLLKNLERFGVDATKPSVTNIKQPLEIQDENELSASKLSPFNINPKPY